LARLLDIYVHIGSGKTGTTSIQRFLAHNRSKLADLGFFYPETPGQSRHARLSLFATRDGQLERSPIWRRVESVSPTDFRARFGAELQREVELSGMERVILSDEALFGLTVGAIGRLGELLSTLRGELHVVVYLRRQDDHLISRYQEVVRIGETRTMADWADRDSSRMYDYQRRLAEWSGALQPSSMIVRRFERSSFVDGSLVQDFLSAVGIDSPLAAFDRVPPAVNQSLDADAVEFLRLWNLRMIEHHGATARRIDNRKRVRQLRKHSTGPVLTLPDDVLDTFMAQWEEANPAVATRYLGADDGRLFQEPRKSDHTTSDQRLSAEALERIFERLAVPLRARRQVRALAEREYSAAAR
jgi:hypothetical protein